MTPSRILASLAVGAALACSPDRFQQKEDERFALAFLRLVREDRIDDAFAALDSSVRNSAARSALEQIHRLLPPGEPTRIDAVGASFFTWMQTGQRTSNLTFQLQYPSKWFVANVVVRTTGSERIVLGFHVSPLADSLQKLNAFTLHGKSPRHFAFLAFGSLAVIANVAAVVVCARTRLRRKPLWLLISALGGGQIFLNWTTGATATRSISVQLLSVSMTRANEYAPWVLAVSFPVGALLFFTLRRKLMAMAIPPPEFSLDRLTKR